MGLIKTEKLANGNIGLEITYGGKEAPFGGIDASMPPQYIDPLCVVDADGFVIVNGQYVAVTFQPLAITINLPASGFTAPQLAGFGSFYTEAQGWQNFAVINGDKTNTPGGSLYTANVALYVWPSANTAAPPSIPFSFVQAQTVNPGMPGSADIQLTNTPGSGSGYSTSIAITPPGGGAAENYGPFAASLSPSAMATAIANAVNGLPSVICTAAVDPSGTSVTLTLKTFPPYPGNADITYSYGGGILTYTGTLASGPGIFNSGIVSSNYPTALAPYPISWVQVGESLFIGGPGTVILQYTNQIFSILSQFVGVNVLRKFAGSLVGLGITPSPGTVLQNAEMMIAWSAAGNFSTWNPTDSNGNVTGAGFEELADIGDTITGGFVNSSTIVILRAQGVSYATATGSASLPFDINHVDLAPEGEGCQSPLLSSQYGPIGFYVGNTNVYQFVQQGQAVGDKIKDYLFGILSPEVSTSTLLAATKACSSLILNSEEVFFSILANNTTSSYVFLYHPSGNTWTRILLGSGKLSTVDSVYLDEFPLLGSTGAAFIKQPQLILGTGDSTNKIFKFYALTEQVPNADSLSNTNPLLQFAAEEISHGRDITIDGLYVTMAGTAGQQVQFHIKSNGSVIAGTTFTFPVGASYTVPADYQIYMQPVASVSNTSTITAKIPQLEILVVQNASGVSNQFRLAKATLFGSFDPQQRPV